MKVTPRIDLALTDYRVIEYIDFFNLHNINQTARKTDIITEL